MQLLREYDYIEILKWVVDISYQLRTKVITCYFCVRDGLIDRDAQFFQMTNKEQHRRVRLSKTLLFISYRYVDSLASL